MDRCQVAGCNRDADVIFQTYHGSQIMRCARHYMDDVDMAGKGAMSAKLKERLAIERENQRIVGGIEYRKQATVLAKKFIRGMK